MGASEDKPSETKRFANTEAAFQALQFWDEADKFKSLSGEQAVELKAQFQGKEDSTYAGYGNSWLGMFAVLRAKFSGKNRWGNALLQTGDAFLLHHTSTKDKDSVWSNNNVGDGTNWLGMQLMLIRDELQVQRGGESRWTGYIQDHCSIDLKTGSASNGVTSDAWQNTVRSATDAMAEKVAKKAEKKVSLMKALMKSDNRTPAAALAFFGTALAIIPLVGLFVCEWLLRGMVQDNDTRWIYSGVGAILCVNFVMVAYVVWCFFEPTPEPEKRSKKNQ